MTQRKRKQTPEPPIESMPWDYLWQRIKWVQRQLGLSARKFSTGCGLSPNAIAAIYARKAEWCDPATIDAIAKFSGYSVSWLKSGRGSPGKVVETPPDDDYPTRKIAALAASTVGVSATAILRILELRESHAGDPGAGYWFKMMWLLHSEGVSNTR